MIFITQEEELQIDLPLQSLYFYASWMVYHKKFLTMISKIEEKYKHIVFYAIDVDQFRNQCKRFDVQVIPTVIVLKGGEEIKRISGLVLTSAFKSVYADICIS
jgi:thioredoxin-like negative regulator of GroEL